MIKTIETWTNIFVTNRKPITNTLNSNTELKQSINQSKIAWILNAPIHKLCWNEMSNSNSFTVEMCTYSKIHTTKNLNHFCEKKNELKKTWNKKTPFFRGPGGTGDHVEKNEGQDEATQHRTDHAGDGAIGDTDDAGRSPGTGRGRLEQYWLLNLVHRAINLTCFVVCRQYCFNYCDHHGESNSEAQRQQRWRVVDEQFGEFVQFTVVHPHEGRRNSPLSFRNLWLSQTHSHSHYAYRCIHPLPCVNKTQTFTNTHALTYNRR